MKKYNKYILVAVCVLCIGFIFFNSSQVSTVSNTRSREVVNDVISLISKTHIGQSVLNKVTLVQLNLIIRKIAHGFEFFLLSMSLCFTLKHFKMQYRDVVIYTLFIVLFSAVMDEFFQIFITDRNSSVVDVLIDFSGAMCAAILFFAFSKLKKPCIILYILKDYTWVIIIIILLIQRQHL